MSYKLETLEQMVEDWNIKHVPASDHDYSEMADQLIIEVKRVEKIMIGHLLSLKNDTMLNSCLTIHIEKLSGICDKLYDKTKEKSGHNTVQPLLNLIELLRSLNPSLIGRDIALTKAFRTSQYETLLAQWKKIISEWGHLNVDPELFEVAFLPLKEFSDMSNEFSWFHYTWIKQYLSSLESINFEIYAPYPTPEYLISDHLALFNFNHNRFLAFCYRILQQRISRYQVKEDQLYFLGVAKKIIKPQPVISDTPFYQDKKSVKEELQQWIKEEIGFRSMFDASILENEGKLVPVNLYKFVYNMKGEQLAFWKKLQYDNGVYGEDNLHNFCAKVANNSSTRNTEDLSAKSIKSKLYQKDGLVL